MVKKLNPILVQKTLLEKKFSVFTPREFQQVFEVSPFSAAKFINFHTSKGFFAKLRNGLYALEDKRPPIYFVANKLYRPSYISLETALSYYSIIPEIVYSVTSVTPKPTQEFDTFGMVFSYTRIKQSAFQGYTAKREAGYTYLIAEPEKALVDYLYLVSLGHKTFNDRTNCSKLDRKKVIGYAKIYKRKSLNQLVEHAWKNNPTIIF